MEDKTVKYSIEILDKWSNGLNKFNSSVDSANRKVGALNASLSTSSKSPHNDVKKSLSQLRSQLSRYKEASENSFRSDHIARYNRMIKETEKQIESLEGRSNKSGGLGGLGIGKGAVGWAAVAVAAVKGVAAFKDFSKESIEASMQVETYTSAVKNMLGGSADAARERMQEYFDIAKKTPFDLPQVIEAGNQLQALGRYSRENVTLLGDLAAASGKPMAQALRAYAKMASGQKGIAVDMFRDLMITTEDWTKATGKGVSKNGELLATTEELLNVLPDIMKSKGYFGMMATQSATTGGRVANLKDDVFQLKVALGDKLSPTVNKFVGISSKAVDTMRSWVEIPLEQKIAKEKAELNVLVESLMRTNEKEERRKTIIDELQRKYPEFLKNIDIEKATTEQLTTALKNANAEYDKKMRKAAMSRRIEDLEASMGEDMDDIAKYETSIEAKKKYAELNAELKRKYGNLSIRGIKEIIKTGQRKTYPNMDGKPVIIEYSEEERADISALWAEMETYGDLMTWFGNDRKKLKKAQTSYERYKQQKSIIEGLFGEEETTDDDKPKDAVTPSGGGGTGIEGAAETISSSSSSKIVNITIDNLIGVNNNVFKEGQGVSEAEGFNNKLRDALIGVLNDVNYMVG